MLMCCTLSGLAWATQRTAMASCSNHFVVVVLVLAPWDFREGVATPLGTGEAGWILQLSLIARSRCREALEAVVDFATASIESGGLGVETNRVVIYGASLGTGD